MVKDQNESGFYARLIIFQRKNTPDNDLSENKKRE